MQISQINNNTVNSTRISFQAQNTRKILPEVTALLAAGMDAFVKTGKTPEGSLVFLNESGQFTVSPEDAVKTLEKDPKELIRYMLTKNDRNETPLLHYTADFKTVNKMHKILKDYPNELCKIYTARFPHEWWDGDCLNHEINVLDRFLSPNCKDSGWEKAKNQKRFFNNLIDLAKNSSLSAQESRRLLSDIENNKHWDYEYNYSAINDLKAILV